MVMHVGHFPWNNWGKGGQSSTVSSWPTNPSDPSILTKWLWAMNSCDSHRAFEPIAARPSAAALETGKAWDTWIILNAEYWESRVDIDIHWLSWFLSWFLAAARAVERSWWHGQLWLFEVLLHFLDFLGCWGCENFSLPSGEGILRSQFPVDGFGGFSPEKRSMISAAL